jgi:GDP-mannose 6-dehydrogenase
MHISIFGLGYVGCVTAACLAKAGHTVIGVDVNPEKVAMVNTALSPIVEPGLAELLNEVVREGRLKATTSSVEAVAGADLAMICIGTPGHSNGQLDVEALARVGGDIGRALHAHPKLFTVVLRSTVLPGTIETVLLPALLAGTGPEAGSNLRVAANPEFMREGSSLRDFAAPPFTVVGCDDLETASLLKSLYLGIEAPFIHTTVKTAEMVKYACNAFHALKICFANEIGDACAALGADAQEVMRVFRMDRKLNVSEAYLRPGFAFGGSCLPKDLRALLYAAQKADVSLQLMSTILPSNDARIRRAVERILRTRRRRVGILGLSFKPDTDDLRESPMVTLAEALIGKGCDVRILDRNVSVARLVGANRRFIEEEIPHIASLMCESVDDLLAHADVVVVANASDDAALALTALGPDQVVVDLTQGAVPELSKRAAKG